MLVACSPLVGLVAPSLHLNEKDVYDPYASEYVRNTMPSDLLRLLRDRIEVRFRRTRVIHDRKGTVADDGAAHLHLNNAKFRDVK